MAVFRVEKTKDFTVMSNYHFRDKRLSLKAKGLLSLILSLPDDWDYTLAGLTTLSDDGIDGVRSGIRELEAAGYLIRNRLRAAKGHLGGTEYIVYEQPIETKSGSPAQEEPMLENPMQANPTQGNPVQENPMQLNTKISSTKESNNYQSNTHSFLPDHPKDEAKETKDYERCREQILENISYDQLREDGSFDHGDLDNLVDILVDTVCSGKAAIRVGRDDKPAAVVKSQLLNLNKDHIEFALECLRNNTTEVKNIRSYLLTVLYNAPATIDSYYTSKVNHDLAKENTQPEDTQYFRRDIGSIDPRKLI